MQEIEPGVALRGAPGRRSPGALLPRGVSSMPRARNSSREHSRSCRRLRCRRAGAGRGEHEKIDLLRSELGGGCAPHAFADMATVGANPARIHPGVDEVRRRRVPGPRRAGIGEPIHAACSSASSWSASSTSRSSTTPSTARPPFASCARTTLPSTRGPGGGGAQPSLRLQYRAGHAEHGLAPGGGPPAVRGGTAPPAGEVRAACFAMGQLRDLRAFVTRHARAAGLQRRAHVRRRPGGQRGGDQQASATGASAAR